MFNLPNQVNGKVNGDESRIGTLIAIRERLLAQELHELEQTLRNLKQCRLTFPSETERHEMDLTITPQEGYYKGGTFKFHISVPLEYNHAPPKVKCLTRIWHPNIAEDGKICLSILRQNSLDEFGWRPTRNISEVIYGLASLFEDLIDFEDPLNVEAAKQYGRDKDAFLSQVKSYIRRYT
ncbi:hypothetical protein WR25_14171 [Diploscapter pachys]|uniref:E2 NEDD8-conjugating enzyme n=1 Tax=Diploscapter pachys TaxID=2018661 RepID=A0A2A2LKP6_9BILA|nr:hypothetical protein WR25_14171 [Diploscapter pachys]